MTTAAGSAFGSTLSWNSTALAEVANITGPTLSIDPIDVTTHDSTSGFREYIAGLRDGGEVTVEGNFISSDASGQIALVTDAKAGTVREMIITGPTAAAFTWTANALCTRFEQTNPHDGKLGFSATFKITGVPTLAVTTSGNLTDLSGIEENEGAALVFTPAFAAAKKTYNVTINTSSTYIKVTPTLAGATIYLYIDGVYSQSVASGAQSGTLAVTDAAVTKISLAVKETGKVANWYYINVYTA